MAGAAHPPCWLFGLRWPHPGVYRLYGRALGKDLQGALHWDAAPRDAKQSPVGLQGTEAFLFPVPCRQDSGLCELELWPGL